MLPQTPRISSRPAAATADPRSGAGGVVVLQAIGDLGLGDLLERPARGLAVLHLDLASRPAVELARPLGGEHDEQVAVGHLFQRLLERGECHHSGTSTSGNLRVSRLVRQRSARMIVASWSTASFTSRLMMR